MTAVDTRPLGGHDVALLKQALYLAIAWDPDRDFPPYEERLMNHPDIAIYHQGWGRPGDLGVVAESEDEFIGLSFCRLFTDDSHGHGYVDAKTPELGDAIVEGHRGEGVGGRLMDELTASAAAAGYGALSLSVSLDNPAQRLYRRLGYEEISRDDEGLRMVLDLRSL